MSSAYNQQKHDTATAAATATRQDIGGLMADLASRPQVNHGRRKLKGPEKAAVLMLSLGERYGGKIFSLLEDDELREISPAASTLGTIDAASVEELLLEFVSLMSGSGGLLGSYDVAERLLQQYLPKDRVGGIMDDIRGPAGRNMWEKLAHVHEEVLANYLKNEYPQTVAVVMSKLRAEHAARVLAILPQDFSTDVISRMLKMEAIQKDVIDGVEETLRTEFMTNLSQTRRRNALSHRAGRGKPGRRRANQSADVHLRRPDQARQRFGADADAKIRQGQAGDRAEGRFRRGTPVLL